MSNDGTTGDGEWVRLGDVERVQIHTDRMVNAGRYHHELIEPVDELWLSPDGVLGRRGSEVLVHAHHRLHPNKSGPQPRDYRPNRLLSIGFSGHYRLTEERFGPVQSGCAAEDIVVTCDRRVLLEELVGGVQLRRAETTIDLTGAAVAKPCVPYTKFLLDDDGAEPDVVAPNRAFLEDGMRGFVFGLANQMTATPIMVGDEVWARA